MFSVGADKVPVLPGRNRLRFANAIQDSLEETEGIFCRGAGRSANGRPCQAPFQLVCRSNQPVGLEEPWYFFGRRSRCEIEAAIKVDFEECPGTRLVEPRLYPDHLGMRGEVVPQGLGHVVTFGPATPRNRRIRRRDRHHPLRHVFSVPVRVRRARETPISAPRPRKCSCEAAASNGPLA